MKRKIPIIIICVLVSIIIIVSFLTCEITYNYSFINDDKLNENLYLSLWLGYPAYNFRIYDYYESEQKIENIEFINGYIQIGEFIVPIETNESIDVAVFVDGNRFFSYEKDEMALTNMKYIQDKILYNYTFYFNKMIFESTVVKINNEYNKKNIKTKLYFKYKILVKNEPIIREINQEFELKIKKYTYNIFSYILWWIIKGGRH